MAISTITPGGILLRFLFACILVFATYNPHPSGYSFYHMVSGYLNGEPIAPLPIIAFIGIILLIGWVIYLRAAGRSLGFTGILLAVAFFGTLVWLAIHYKIISLENPSVLTYVIEFVICCVLTVGISWSHIRRRITGQLDTDDVEAD